MSCLEKSQCHDVSSKKMVTRKEVIQLSWAAQGSQMPVPIAWIKDVKTAIVEYSAFELFCQPLVS